MIKENLIIVIMEQLKELQLERAKIFQASTGFELVTFAISVQMLYHWATRPYRSLVNCEFYCIREVLTFIKERLLSYQYFFVIMYN